MEVCMDDLEIPEGLRLSAQQRKEGWVQNPPKAAPARLASPKKTEKPKREDKTEMVLAMLKGEGATVDALCKATDWLPHTLRARLSAISKPKKAGGLGIKIERTRVDGVTSYRSL